MKKFLLNKYSSPDPWAKLFHDRETARIELLTHICGLCLAGSEFDTIPPDPLDINSLLSTSCGCEYGLEEIDVTLEPEFGVNAILHIMHQIAEAARNKDMDKAVKISNALFVIEEFFPTAMAYINNTYGKSR